MSRPLGTPVALHALLAVKRIAPYRPDPRLDAVQGTARIARSQHEPRRLVVQVSIHDAIETEARHEHYVRRQGRDTAQFPV